MNNTRAVDVSKIKQGDRILVGGTSNWPKPEWGTVGYQMGIYGPKVYMDNLNLEDATGYTDSDNASAPCYYAEYSEIIEHIPASKEVLPEPTREEIANHNMPAPAPLDVHDDIRATLDYLNATTQRKWKATTKEVSLEVDGTTSYAGSMTISFQEDK